MVETRSFKLVPQHLNLRVIKKDFRLPGVQPAGGLGLADGPVHQLGVDLMQHLHAFFALGAQPFSQGGLVGSFGQAQQVHQDPVLSDAFGVGQGSPAAGQGKNQLGDIRGGTETQVVSLARVQCRFLLDALPQIKTATEGVHQHLAPVGRGAVGVGQLEVVFGFSLGVSWHGVKSP
jgi:hypothetical protein